MKEDLSNSVSQPVEAHFFFFKKKAQILSKFKYFSRQILKLLAALIFFLKFLTWQTFAAHRFRNPALQRRFLQTFPMASIFLLHKSHKLSISPSPLSVNQNPIILMPTIQPDFLVDFGHAERESCLIVICRFSFGPAGWFWGANSNRIGKFSSVAIAENFIQPFFGKRLIIVIKYIHSRMLKKSCVQN